MSVWWGPVTKFVARRVPTAARVHLGLFIREILFESRQRFKSHYIAWCPHIASAHVVFIRHQTRFCRLFISDKHTSRGLRPAVCASACGRAQLSAASWERRASQHLHTSLRLSALCQRSTNGEEAHPVWFRWFSAASRLNQRGHSMAESPRVVFALKGFCF